MVKRERIVTNRNGGGATLASARRWIRRARLVAATALVVGCVSFLSGSASALPLEITTYAGAGVATESGDGGPAAAAGVAGPAGAALDAAGNLYVADSIGHTVRKIDAASGTITTIAGTGTVGSSGDGGPAAAAQLANPVDVALDASGNLLIVDYGADVVRKVAADGTISTVAGSAFVEGYTGDGGQASGALLSSPAGIDVDDIGRIHVADMANNAVRRIDTNGVITTIAGGRPGEAGDGGPAASARLRDPADVSVAADGSYFIADYGNDKVRRVDPAGVIHTVAGTGRPGFSGDGGPATLAKLSGPTGVEVDSAGSLFIAEYTNHTIRAVSPSGVITSVAGQGGVPGFAGDNGPAASASLSSPARVVLDGDGDFFVADLGNNRVRRIAALGVPDPPTFVGTTPASPSNVSVFSVQGWAADATSVGLYSDPACGVAIGGGSASAFTTGGIAVTVPDDSVTTVYGRVTDGSGRSSGCSVDSLTITQDSTAPNAPTITEAPGSPSSTPSATWSFAIDEGRTECTLRAADGTAVQGPEPCTTSATYDLSSAAAGVYTFAVVGIDDAGNASPEATAELDLDRLAPPSPVIETRPASPSPQTSVTWTFSGDGTPTCNLLAPDGSAIPAVGPCDSGVASYDLAGRPDGAYTFSVFIVDGAGNRSGEPTSTFERDTTAPGAPVLVSVPQSPSRELIARWTFETVADAVECTLTAPGGAAVVPVVCEGGITEFDLSARTDGVYNFSLVARDDAGNRSGATTSSYELDTTPPASPTIDQSPPAVSNQRSVTWTFINAEGTAGCTLLAPDGSPVVGGTGCVTGATFDLTGHSDGEYTFRVSSSDASGNTSTDATDTYVLDTTGPDAPTLVSSPASPIEPGVVEWAFTVTEGNVTCTLIDESGAFVPGSGCSSGTASYDLSGAPDGDYRFQVVATDAIGNGSGVTSSVITVATPAPTTTTTSTTMPATTTTSTTTSTTMLGAVSGSTTTSTSQVPAVAPVQTTPARAAATSPKASAEPMVSMPPAQADALAPAVMSTATTAQPVERDPASTATRSPELAARPATETSHVASGDLGATVLGAASEVAKRSTIPLALLIVVGLFLLVQNRVDRNDPKLALAPVYPDAELSFGARPFAGSRSGPTIGVHRAR